jgi:glycosyltransferase involved in cell wall biosynthesis
MKPKILYLVTEDWHFCLHWLNISGGARDAGYEVVVATRVHEHGEKIMQEGFKLIPITMQRNGINPFHEWQAIWNLVKLFNEERPLIVHNMTLKPVIYGSIASLLTRIPITVNTLAGLGHIFISHTLKARILRPLIETALHFALNRKNSRVIVMNPDDYQFYAKYADLQPDKVVVIRGVGVDVNKFQSIPEPQGEPVVTLVSRMLWEKGIGELVEASRFLKESGDRCRVVLVGQPDPENPSSIAKEQLMQWQNAGIIEWWGYNDNIPSIWERSHIAILPSYREGLPTALIEAAASGRPIIATDVPGCREVVRQDENGILVPVRNATALANAIRRLIRDPKLRQEMGRLGRSIAVREFSIEKVVKDTLAVYRELLEC